MSKILSQTKTSLKIHLTLMTKIKKKKKKLWSKIPNEDRSWHGRGERGTVIQC